MLKVTIMENAMIFHGLGDAVYKVIDNNHFEIKVDGEKYRVNGTPQKLYNLLYVLAKDFDIEIV